MVKLYVIKDEVGGGIYVGITNNLERRLKEHNAGYQGYTKRFKAIVLIYTEDCVDYKEARKREKYFKSGCGREFLKNIKAGVV